jgi:hypothetical protein
MRHGRADVERRLLPYLLMIIVCLFALSGCSLVNSESGGTPKATTEYQAVFLDNGTIYFGKLENAGSKYPLLKDVYYIQSGQDPTTNQINNVLTKRGSEPHGPDTMYINANHIIMIESVTSESKVAKLIQEAKTKK